MADYWIKLYHEIIDDPKMATMPDRLWRRSIELMLLAGRLSKERTGHLPDTRQIAWALRISVDEIQLDLEQLQQTGIIKRTETGWYIVNFEKRQSAASDLERKQQERKRKQSQQYNDNVTDLSRNVTQITDIQITDKDIDKNPPKISSLHAAFVTGFQRDYYSNECDSWANEFSLMAKEGVTGEDITQAFKQLKGRYTITSPKSIKNAAITCKNNRLNPQSKNGNGKKLSDIKFDNIDAIKERGGING